MNKPWTAEIVVDGSLAAFLVQDQFPDLSPATVELLGAGWDNTVFRINGRFVFRFPRREIAGELLQTELRCLPILAPRLPVPIPIPIYSGRPSRSYPWPFAGYAYVVGHRAPLATPDARWRKHLATAIAEFLKVLHAVPPTDLPSGAIPLDTLARLDMRSRRAATESRLTSLRDSGAISGTSPVLDILDAAPAPPDPSDPAITHGDLHIEQLLVSNEGRLAGVIDWGDLHLGHAAVDLAIGHQLLPPLLHDVFLSKYGAVDPTTWSLAKARAACTAVALLASSIDRGDMMLAAEAKRALEFITE